VRILLDAARPMLISWPMERLKPWKVLGTEKLQDCAVFSVSRALTRSPVSGEVHPFYRIDADAWVNVVPLTEDDQLVMIRQYRHGARDFTLEIPGGIVDAGESPETAAIRELLEETGYQAADVFPIGEVNPNPALFGNRVHTFLAPRVDRIADVRNTELEETAVELIDVEEVPELLRTGRIDHALVVAALYWWDLHDRGIASGR